MDPQEQIEFFYEIFDPSLPRLGPGDDASTRRALNVLKGETQFGNSPRFRILDIGCGNGPQTIQLAKLTHGTILALDNHQPFLDELRRRAEAEAVSDRIHTWLKDMGTLGPDDGPFDLIWSEGALYIMGFNNGLAACHSLLTCGGLLAVSELSWLKPDPPAECTRYFSNEYPTMSDAESNLSAGKNCGYKIVGHFTLPDSAWWESYYQPLEMRLQIFREKYAADRERLDMVESVQMEIEIFRKYSRYYGYIFYLMQHC